MNHPRALHLTSLIFSLLTLFSISMAQNTSDTNGFDVIALGATGGMQDGNLSAFLIQPHGDNRAVTCDAGSIVNGLRVADEKGSLDTITVPEDSEYNRIGYVLTDVIKGYMISHAHLDHVAGMIISSPDDSAKPIYSLESVLDTVEATHFNWQAWPNFGDEGAAPLNKYDYMILTPGEAQPLANTAMQVTAFPLDHDAMESTAFLIESGDDALLCLGDTGPDSVEETDNLLRIWQAVAEKAKNGSLKAIIMESSYTSDRPDDLLFGHLTPKYVMQELHVLADLAGEGSLEGLPVIISHVKYSIKKGDSPQDTVMQELNAANDLGLEFIMPEQGMKWHFGD